MIENNGWLIRKATQTVTIIEEKLEHSTIASLRRKCTHFSKIIKKLAPRYPDMLEKANARP